MAVKKSRALGECPSPPYFPRWISHLKKAVELSTLHLTHEKQVAIFVGDCCRHPCGLWGETVINERIGCVLLVNTTWESLWTNVLFKKHLEFGEVTVAITIKVFGDMDQILSYTIWCYRLYFILSYLLILYPGYLGIGIKSTNRSMMDGQDQFFFTIFDHGSQIDKGSKRKDWFSVVGAPMINCVWNLQGAQSYQRTFRGTYCESQWDWTQFALSSVPSLVTKLPAADKFTIWKM